MGNLLPILPVRKAVRGWRKFFVEGCEVLHRLFCCCWICRVYGYYFGCGGSWCEVPEEIVEPMFKTIVKGARTDTICTGRIFLWYLSEWFEFLPEKNVERQLCEFGV